MSQEHLDFSILNELDLKELRLNKRFIDNISGSYLNSNTFKLNPYQVLWVSLTD